MCCGTGGSLLGLGCKVVARIENSQDLPRENQVDLLSWLGLNYFDNLLLGHCLWIGIVGVA